MDKTAAGCGSPSPEGVIVQTDALPAFSSATFKLRATRHWAPEPSRWR